MIQTSFATQMLKLCMLVPITYQMGLAKRKSAFEHAQSVRIHIILYMLKVSSGHLLSIGTV